MFFAFAGAAIVLFLLAWFCLRSARGQEAKASALTLTDTSTCGEIAELAKSVGSEVGAGSFSQRCEVIGLAELDGGGVHAPETRADVVWHRTRVTHRWYEMERTTDSRGKTSTRRVEKSDVVSDYSSEIAFAVADGSGRVLVKALGAEIDEPEKSVDRMDGVGSDVATSFTSLLLGGGQSGTIGFEVEEWVLRPGTRIYVHGEVGDDGGRLVFGAGDGRLLVSTRSEREIVAGHRSGAKWLKVGAIAAVTLGAASIVAAIVSLFA
ncbi:GIDE domain-containing protein [Conexibacter stalactiti]|uniref:RING-type E3 ubiquitin transferase n=1 Tax=Conexibacter stalactiti TaxID=1940611 RepID=A0ABU4HQZ2_9ACTN|nr:GIDE domain-containing protein [Conexibacter stalactiti]MDW5595742.1 GIDE domain-containing protein [Conexibacter stalactiti]MEC5036384.1 GIDE domain-containing protein [Conexibacter stalactiti]